jgi:hypothetical protein
MNTSSLLVSDYVLSVYSALRLLDSSLSSKDFDWSDSELHFELISLQTKLDTISSLLYPDAPSFKRASTAVISIRMTLAHYKKPNINQKLNLSAALNLIYRFICQEFPKSLKHLASIDSHSNYHSSLIDSASQIPF